MENKNVGIIELNSLVTACKPGIENSEPFKYTVEEAHLKYIEKRKLVDDVFRHVGAENYVEITAILYSKCFRYVDMEERSRHIMYRALVGTNIDSSMDKGKFIYDKHDKTLEVYLAHIVYADGLEAAVGIIDAIKPDLDKYEDDVKKEIIN